MIEKYLMSYEDYSKVKHSVPHFYNISSGNQVLYYFGANHSRNPLDEQYQELRKFWDDFIKKTNKQESFVFVEGGERPVNISEEEAIHNGAEANLITYLASQHSIKTYSPEPPDKLIFENLLSSFSKDEIIYHEFAKMTCQWNRYAGNKPDYSDYTRNFLKNIRASSGWIDFDFSFENIMKIHKNIFEINFNENDGKFFYDITNPTIELSIINRVCRINSILRDQYILRSIEDYWNRGKNLFIVYGYTHSIMHEPALKKLIF